MKPEDLFAAIGGVESSRLARSELSVRETSRKGATDGPEMKHKNPKNFVRNLLIAAVIVTILSVTAYAAVTARIRVETTRYQHGNTVNGEPTGTYNVEIDFQKTTGEYLELGSVYPQQVPDEYQLSFVSDKALGRQALHYSDATGEEAIYFAVQLGSENLQFELTDVDGEEPVTIQNNSGVLYHHEDGSRTIIWLDEEQGFGFTLHGNSEEIDLLSIARSVGPGEPLTPTLASGYDTALFELGDYRITALPDGFAETGFMASPLEDGGGWYAYVRRWYSDKVTSDNTICFVYEHFRPETAEPSKPATEPVENTPETILRYMGGGESTTIQGMPGAINGESVIWVDLDAQVVFRITASNRTTQEMLALAASVQRFN